MSKVIFLLTNKLTKGTESFNTLIKSYKDEKFVIHLFEDYTDAICLNDYESIALHLNEHDLSEYDFVTDNAIFLTAWYRIFHSKFRNFIFIFQNYNKPEYKNYSADEIQFYSKLMSLNGVLTENLYKKIYVNLNGDNYIEIFNILFKLTHKFELLENYNFTKYIQNQPNNKRYHISKIKNIEFYFVGNDNFENIKLYKNDFTLERFLFKENLEDYNFEIISFLLLYIYKSSGLKDLINILEYLSTIIPKSYFDKFLKIIISKIERISGFQFIDKVNFLFVILKFSSEKDLIGDKLYNFVFNDKTQIKYHQNIIKNLNVLVFGNCLPNNEHYYEISRETFKKVSYFYENKLKQQINKNPIRNNKIAVLIDQLLVEHHAPTKVLMTTIKELLKYTTYEILIIVEENLLPSPEERFPTEVFTANESILYKEIHREYFLSDRVNIIYSDPEKDKKERMKYLVDCINDYTPDTVISFSGYSILQNLIYGKIPIIYISFGTEYSTGLADLYLYKNEKKAIELDKKFGYGDLEKIKKFIYDIQFLKSTKEYTRSDLGFTDKDFIIITVGNRLDTEIQSDLIEPVMNLLLKYNNIKWLLVGSTIPDLLEKNYKMFIGNRIRHIPFEEDLLAITKITDVFLNPNRIGGGYSVAAAMKVGIPVLTTNFDSDGLVFVGRENAIGEKYSDLITELEKMYLNQAYKKNKGKVLQNRMIKIENEKSIFKLLEFIDEVQKRFIKDELY